MSKISSPLSRKLTSNISPQDSSLKESSRGMPRFYQKFQQISSLIEEDHEVSSFNLIDYDKEKRPDTIFDNTMKKAKLKQIENNFELQRANMELKTRKSKFRPQKNHFSQTKEKSFCLQRSNTVDVQTIFQSFKKSLFDTFPRKMRFESMNSVDFEELMKPIQRQDDSGEGINFYNQLKKHPQLLNYTRQKIRLKEGQKERDVQEKLKNINLFNSIEPFQDTSLRKHQSQTLESKVPQAKMIVEDKRRKLFTKSIKKNCMFLENSPEILEFRHEQNKVYTYRTLSSLSQENQLKLREKLDKIALQIYESRKPFFRQNNLLPPYLPRKRRPNFST